MKHSLKTLSFLLAAGTLSLTACNNDTKSTSSNSDSTATSMQTTAPAADSSKMAANNTNANSDQDFINTLVQGNTKELAWLQAGASKGGKEVKEHAKMMMKDHMKLASDVKDYTAKKNLTMPTVDTAGVVTINDKTGKDFDMAWTDKMVSDHTDLLATLNNAMGTVKDADLKTMIGNTTTVVQSHLDMAKQMQAKMKK